MVLGIGAAALLGSHSFGLRKIAEFYLWIIQGTPLLVQIFFFYFVIPGIGIPGITVNEWGAGIMALTFNVGAYHARAIHAGIEAVPKGQWEAATSLGLSRRTTFRLVILPQALKLMVEPLLSNLIALIKDSALVSSIGLLELSLVGSRISSETFKPAPVLITVAILYLWMTTGLLFLSQARTKPVKAGAQ
jgi:polar amino acid transport system permease protein